MSFFSDVYTSPALVSFILISLWIYVKINIDNWDIKKLQVGYSECIVNHEWHRIFSFAVSHESIVHLILNISALWSLRIAEKIYGTMFIFKYTIILGLFETLSTLAVVHWVIKHSRWYFPPQHPIHNTSVFGFTSIILGWLGYLSIDLMVKRKNLLFYVFGLLPIPIPLAPIALMLIANCIMPRSHTVSHAGGLFGGYLLALGFLQILPDTYWTICFFANMFLVLSYLLTRGEPQPLTLAMVNQRRANDPDTFDVIPYEGRSSLPPSPTESRARISDHENMPLLAWANNNSDHDNGIDDRINNIV